MYFDIAMSLGPLLEQMDGLISVERLRTLISSFLLFVKMRLRRRNVEAPEDSNEAHLGDAAGTR